MDRKNRKASAVSELLRNVPLNERLDSAFPSLFPATLFSLIDLMKQTNEFTGQSSPRAQYVKDQFQLVVYDCVRLVRKKRITLEMLHAHLDNLGKLFERVHDKDLEAAERSQYYFQRLVIVLNPLLTYLERAQPNRRTDWPEMVCSMLEAVRRRQAMRGQKRFHPKLTHFQLGATLCVRVNSILRRGSFGDVECVLRFTPFRAENTTSRSFAAEKEAASMTSSIFLPQVHACFNTVAAHVYCTEYVRGVSSYRVLMEAKYFDDRILRVVLGQVGLALDYLHTTGIIHRDLYMPNILMMRGCRVKLIGLQHSKVCMGKFSENFTVDKIIEFEQEDEPLGSNRYYMAPELLAGKPYGRGVDWWSLGITCFNLACGKQPFDHLAEDELSKQLESVEIVWPEFRNPSWQLQKFVSKCLQPPETRMNFEVFRRHSFFEGLDWDRLQEHELWEDFPSLDRAFSREKDDDNSSPSPSPSAEEETSQIPGKGQFFMDVDRQPAGIFIYASSKFRRTVEERDALATAPSIPYAYRDEKLKEGHQLVQFIIFRSKILGLFWESFGFKFEEHTNHLGEVLLVAAKVEPDGNAERGGLLEGDVIVRVGDVCFWPGRSIRKSGVVDLIETATNRVFVTAAVCSMPRILHERRDASSVVNDATKHTVTLRCRRDNSRGPTDFGLLLKSCKPTNTVYILVDRIVDGSLIESDPQQLWLLNGDVVVSLNGKAVPSGLPLVENIFKGCPAGSLMKVEVAPTSALRLEVSWRLWA